jgi:hypothetical protein
MPPQVRFASARRAMDDIRSYAEVARALHKICKIKSGKQNVTSIGWSGQVSGSRTS